MLQDDDFENWSPEMILFVQLFSDKLRVPFGKFHNAVAWFLNDPHIRDLGMAMIIEGVRNRIIEQINDGTIQIVIKKHP